MRAAPLALVLLTLAACGEHGGGDATGVGPGPTPVATVEIEGQPLPLAVGATVQLSATARDAGGRVVSGKTFTWTSSQPARATVSATGLVTAVAPGAFVIKASVEGTEALLPLQVLEQQLVAVALAADVSSAARSKVAAIVSLGGSAGVGDAVLAVPLGTPHTLVFAVNDAGQPLFTALAAGLGPIALGPRSTAVALVRMLLAGPGDATGLAVAESRITGHPAFDDIVAAIEASSASGSSYAASDPVVLATVKVARDLKPANPSRHSGLVSATGDPVTVGDGPGTSYTITNTTRIAIGVASGVPGQGPQGIIDEKVVRDAPVDLRGVNGEVALAIGPNFESTQTNAVTVMTDVISLGIEFLIGKDLTPNRQMMTQMATTLVSTDVAVALVEQPFPENVGTAMAVVATNLPKIAAGVVDNLLERGVYRAGFQLAFAQYVGFASKALTLLEWYEKTDFYADLATYGHFSSRSRVCQYRETLHSCVDRIVVSPAATQLSYGSTSRVQAVLYGIDGQRITLALPVEWSTANAAIATVDSSGMVNPVAYGSTRVTAAAAGKSAEATVSMEPLSTRLTTPSTTLTGDRSLSADGTIGTVTCSIPMNLEATGGGRGTLRSVNWTFTSNNWNASQRDSASAKFSSGGIPIPYSMYHSDGKDGKGVYSGFSVAFTVTYVDDVTRQAHTSNAVSITCSP